MDNQNTNSTPNSFPNSALDCSDSPQNTAEKRDWQAYYNETGNRPPRKTILTALNSFSQPGKAVDLGCGVGRDTVEILRRNWQVLAIDKQPEAIAGLLARDNINRELLTTQVMSFEELQLPQGVDLINASFSLSFCHKDAWNNLWETITNAISIGGRFSGNLFGDRDSWRDSGMIHCLSREEMESCLKPYEIELFEEEENFGKTPLGEERYWHIFHVVARKKAE